LATTRKPSEGLFVDLFVAAQRRASAQIILDLDATDNPLHRHQEGASSTAITTAITNTSDRWVRQVIQNDNTAGLQTFVDEKEINISFTMF
jgi:hypothetical protein